MGNVQQINNQEVGRDVRDKLNEVREKANQVDDKINLVPTAEQGNVAIFGANGQILDSGLRPGGGAGVNVPSWETVRNIPLAINFVVQFNGRLFSNKVDQNQNNQPPLEGEDTFWRETSEAQSTSTPLYAAGIFREARSEVYVLNIITNQLEKYVLTVTDLPFISTDFNAEIAAGQWQSASGANLSVTRDLNVVNVISEVGTNAILPSATTLLAGVMSAADKTRLDNAAILTVANTFQDNITVNGNLNVVGDITFQNQQELNVTDNLIDVNSGETGAGVTGEFAGMVIDRGSLPNFGILFRESDDLFRIGCFDTFRSDAVSGTANTIVLPSDASSQDDTYNNARIRITKSGEFPQFRTITDYVGATRTATVDQAWSIIPDNTWAVRILIEDDTQAVMTRVDTPDDGLPFFWDATNKRSFTRAITHVDVSDFDTEVNTLISAGIGNVSSLSFANQVKIAAIDEGVNVTGSAIIGDHPVRDRNIRIRSEIALSPNPGSTAFGGIIEAPNFGNLLLDLRNNDPLDSIAFRYASVSDGVVDTVGFVMKGNGNVGVDIINPNEKLTVADGNIEINNTDSALVLNQVLGKYQFRSADVSGVGNTGVACSMAAVSSNSTGSNIDLVFGIRGGLVGNDVERLRVNTGGIAVTGTVIASNVFNNATQTLTGTTPTHDCLTSVNSQITLSGNTTVTFTNLTNGMSGNMRVTQDGTGSRTLTFSPTPEVINGGGGVITLTGNASSTDIISWWYDGTNLNVTYGLNYS